MTEAQPRAGDPGLTNRARPAARILTRLQRVEYPAVSDLLVIEFPSEEKAEGVREMLLAMQKEYLIELGDAVIAVKEAGGRVKLNQLFQPVARGAVSGALWGSLIGLLFMMPLVGDWDRCRFRRARRKARRSRHQRRVHSAGRENAAIRQRCAFLLIRNMTTDKVFAALRGVGDTVIAQLVRRNQRRNQRRSLTRGAGGHAGGRANRRLNSDRCRVFWLS